MKTKIILSFFLLIILLCGCQNNTSNDELDKLTEDNTLNFNYTFDNSIEGFMGGLAGVFDDDPTDTTITTTVDNLTTQTNKGIFLTCGNENKDVYKYTTKKISTQDGLSPLTSYKIYMSFNLSSNENKHNSIPLKEVIVHAGIVNICPDIELIQSDYNSYFLITPNKEFDTINNKLIPLGNMQINDESHDISGNTKTFEHTFNAFTNSNGELWIIIGIDSSHTGISSIFLDNVIIDVQKGKATFS